MPIQFEWYGTDRILLIRHIGNVTVDELEQGIGQYLAHLDAAQHPICLIADWGQTHGYPLQFRMVSKSMRILRHENQGYIALVGMNPSVSFWLEFFARLIRLNYKVFDSVEEAARFLDGIDRSQEAPS
jgi:hypothetical protein